MTFHSGKKGTVTINGVEIPIRNWSVNPSVPLAAFVNSKSGGFVLRESAAGMTASFSFVVDQDFDLNQFDAPTSLVIGVKLTNVKLYLNGTSDIYWNFPSAYISDTPQSVNISGTDGIATTVSCASDGTFAYPGGITPSNGV